jgi:hypothetical protein
VYGGGLTVRAKGTGPKEVARRSAEVQSVVRCSGWRPAARIRASIRSGGISCPCAAHTCARFRTEVLDDDLLDIELAELYGNGAAVYSRANGG